jgi:hypothetical protein
MEAGVKLSGDPFLHLAWRKERQQLEPEEARRTAMLLLELAVAAEYEAAFTRWVRDKLGLTVEQGAVMLAELRTYFRLAEERSTGGMSHA